MTMNHFLRCFRLVHGTSNVDDLIVTLGRKRDDLFGDIAMICVLTYCIFHGSLADTLISLGSMRGTIHRIENTHDIIELLEVESPCQLQNEDILKKKCSMVSYRS